MEYLLTLCRGGVVMTDLIKSFSGYAEEIGRFLGREKEKKSSAWIT